MKLEEIEKLLGEITQEQWERDGRFVYALAEEPSLNRFFPSMSNKFQASVQPCGIHISTEELEANARLIAAAPTVIRQLLDDNKRLRDVLKAVEFSYCGDDPHWNTACPKCYRPPHQGHSKICIIGNALKEST